MDIKTESLSQVRRRVTFAIPAVKVNAAFASVTQRYADKAKIPGFRPGKAPAGMIERMYGADLRRAVLDKLLQDNVFAAIEQAELKAVGRPEVEELSELKKDTDLQVTAAVEVLPDLELTGYEGAALTADAIEATDADVQDALEEAARSKGEWQDLDGSAEKGDELTVTYTLTESGSDADPVQGNKEAVLLGSGKPNTLLDRALAGAKAGDHIDALVTAEEGDEGFAAGAAVHVVADVDGVKRFAIPAVDDALAVTLGHADLAAWKAAETTKLQEDATRRTRDLRRRAALDNLLATNSVEVPASVVESYVDEQLRRMFGNFRREDMRGLEQFLGSMRANLAKDAESALRRSLALESIAGVAAIAVSTEDVQAEIERLVAEESGRKELLRRQYANEQARTELEKRIQHERTMDWLVDKAAWTAGATKSLREAKAPAEVAAIEDAIDVAAEAEVGHVHDENCNHDH
jgi:trigger factor